MSMITIYKVVGLTEQGILFLANELAAKTKDFYKEEFLLNVDNIQNKYLHEIKNGNRGRNYSFYSLDSCFTLSGGSEVIKYEPS